MKMNIKANNDKSLLYKDMLSQKDQYWPKMSIITPSFNQGGFIEKTILSVLNQDYPYIEYIVMDGGSTDNTLLILKEYEDRIIWKSEADKGQSDAVNKGFELATGEILAWLNSDDTYKPGCIRTVANHFLNNTKLDVLFGDCNLIDEFDEQIGIYKAGPINFNKWLYRGEIYVAQPSVFFRKSIIEKIGRLDKALHINMDHDFWIRMAKAGLNMKYINVTLSNFRFHKSSKTTQAISKHRIYHLRLLKKYGIGPYLFYFIRYIFLLKIKKILFGEKKILKRKPQKLGNIFWER